MQGFGQRQEVDLRNCAETAYAPLAQRLPAPSEKVHLFWQPWPYTISAKREPAALVWRSGRDRGGDTRANAAVLWNTEPWPPAAVISLLSERKSADVAF